ncbi:MAG: hypothetical protein COV75_05150 [Candidatus Omnitrophica bacterium CG11_big_fil_rev_8_21_14_0_20_63_9]|nr:MAG: hypothetical protein COV75_05150 [Candidatus Omnitrophica bacterium CG11_big_fil_rev_8_21_14_0_20_63_9]
MVVADSPLGVRIVSVDNGSQAQLAGLRPEDIIVRIHDEEVHSIDEFAQRSQALKGHVISAAVVVFRNGSPKEVTVHLYSYPILRAWAVTVLPDHDVRFAEAKTGLEYWTRLGRGFASADKFEEALQAYFNALHNMPTETPVAVKACALLLTVSRQRLSAGNGIGGIEALGQATTMMERLFDLPLTDEELRELKDRLAEALKALREFSSRRACGPDVRLVHYS